MRVYLVPTMEKKEYRKKKRNHLYDQNKKGKKSWDLNFLHLLEDYVFQTLFLITNFFKIKTGLLIKIKTHVVIVLSYLSTIKIITMIETKCQIKQSILQLEFFLMYFPTVKLFLHLIMP